MNFLRKKSIEPSSAEGSASKVEATAKERKNTLIVMIVGIVLAVILLPICIINCVLVIKGIADPDDVPSVFGVMPMVVLSGSMSETILEGDLIFLKEVDDAGELEVGDIIAFYTGTGTEVVTHRIVGVSKVDGVTYYTTKGDYFLNSVDIDLVAETSVIGLYDGSRIGGIGNLIIFMQEPYGIALFIGIPVIAYIAYEVLSRMQSQKKKAVALAAESANKAAEESNAELAKLRAEMEELKALQSAQAEEASATQQQEPSVSVDKDDKAE